MPETLEELYVRAVGNLSMPALDEWETFPFEGALRPRERAVTSVGGIGRVHVYRWGDGSEHLHWWFMARPARLPQLVGSFAAIWDDVLPPTPETVWRESLAIVARVMETSDA